MKIDLSADIYEDSGLEELLSVLYDGLERNFKKRQYGNDEVALFFVVICDPKNLKQRKRYDKQEKVLYWDVMVDYWEIKRMKINDKAKSLASQIVSSFDVLDRYKYLGLDKEKIKDDMHAYFKRLGWV